LPESKFTKEVLEDIFTYHAPRPDQIPKYNNIREAAKVFANIIVENTPSSADQSAAIRMLRELVMTCNQSIALDGKY
jgi:hypothetical protein